MSKCNKAKNPCKICLSPVSHKTGLQCQGACQTWVHYSCLNYTPGKIKDIKAGIIKVTCPCPDCKTSLPKEFRTDQPYSCNNAMCPANQPPKCDNYECPTNSGGRSRGMAPQPIPCPLNKCGNQCKEYSNPHEDGKSAVDVCPPPKPCMPESFGESASDACLSKNPKCPSGCSSTNDVSGDYGAVTSCVPPPTPNFAVVEQMCNTVGDLTNQLKELMCQMKQAANREPPRRPCPAQGPKGCPKPCYCPGNPGRRM